MNIREEALQLHTEWRGKIEVCSRVDVACKHDLSTAYTPGVAEPCRAIHADPSLVDYTRGAGISWPSCPTDPPYWGWAT